MEAIIGFYMFLYLFGKLLSEGVSDWRSAKTGMASPRQQAKYGSSDPNWKPAQGPAGYGLVGHLRGSWNDYWPRRTEAVRAARDARDAARAGGTDMPPAGWVQQLRAATQAGRAAVARVVDSPAGQVLIRPVGEPDRGEDQRPRTKPKPAFEVGEVRYDADRRVQWDGHQWVDAPWCAKCNTGDPGHTCAADQPYQVRLVTEPLLFSSPELTEEEARAEAAARARAAAIVGPCLERANKAKAKSATATQQPDTNTGDNMSDAAAGVRADLTTAAAGTEEAAGQIGTNASTVADLADSVSATAATMRAAVEELQQAAANIRSMIQNYADNGMAGNGLELLRQAAAGYTAAAAAHESAAGKLTQAAGIVASAAEDARAGLQNMQAAATAFASAAAAW
jgi:hypothetical protein